MRHVTLRTEVPVDAPAPAAIAYAADRLRWSATELGLTIAEPVRTTMTGVDEDRVAHLETRWVIARAMLVSS